MLLKKERRRNIESFLTRSTVFWKKSLVIGVRGATAQHQVVSTIGYRRLVKCSRLNQKQMGFASRIYRFPRPAWYQLNRLDNSDNIEFDSNQLPRLILSITCRLSNSSTNSSPVQQSNRNSSPAQQSNCFIPDSPAIRAFWQHK